MNVWFYFKREDLTVVSGEDNLCMFRCLAVFNESRDMEAEVEKSRARWVKANGPIVRGISMAHLDRFEAMFGVGVAMYINKIDEDNIGALRTLRSPSKDMTRVMSVMADPQGRHVDLLNCPPVSCRKCEDLFTNKSRLKTHRMICDKTCERCGYKFTRVYTLKQHSLTCNGKRRRGIPKTLCHKCGTFFDVPATFTAHIKLCGDPGIEPVPSTSGTKKRFAGSLAKRAQKDIFVLLAENTTKSTRPWSADVMRKLMHKRVGEKVPLDMMKDLEVVSGLRIDVFTRTWNEDHRRFIVSQIHTSTLRDMTARKVAIHAPDPEDLVTVNIIESMSSYAGVFPCRWVRSCVCSLKSKSWYLEERRHEMWQTKDAIENKLCFRSCGSWYRRPSDLKRHENSCLRGVNIKYVGGPYNTSETIFDKLAKIGVFIPQDMRWSRFRATFDLESYMKKTVGNTRHVPMSVSVASNVPGRQGPMCFVSTGDPQRIVNDMLEWLMDTADEVARLERRRYTQYLRQLENIVKQFSADQKAYDPSEQSAAEVTSAPSSNKALEVMAEFVEHLERLTIVGFNSSNYDLPLIKPYLAHYLMGEQPNVSIPREHEAEDSEEGEADETSDELLYCCQKNYKVITLVTRRLKFVDVMMYLAPGTSYAR